MQNTIFFSNFAPIRFSTSYHNKAICRRTLILRALFGGLFCYFNRKAIYNGNVVTWSDVPRLLATSFDNNWHFVLIFLPVQKRLFRLSSKHLTMNWLNKAAHVFQTTFGCKVNIPISDCPNILTTFFTFKFFHFVYLFMLTTYRLICKTLHIFHRKTSAISISLS